MSFVILFLATTICGTKSEKQVHVINPQYSDTYTYHTDAPSSFISWSLNKDLVTLSDSQATFHRNIRYLGRGTFYNRYCSTLSYQDIVLLKPTTLNEIEDLPHSPFGYNLRVRIFFWIPKGFLLDPVARSDWFRRLHIHDATITIISYLQDRWIQHWICPVKCGKDGLIQSSPLPEILDSVNADRNIRMDYLGSPVAHPGVWERNCRVELFLKKPILCSADSRFLQTVQRFFNFTFQVPPDPSYGGRYYGSLRGSSDFPLFISLFAFNSPRNLWWEGLPFIKYLDDYLLVYCQNELEYRGNAASWIAPFGRDVWLSIGAAFLSTVAVLSVGNLRSLIDNCEIVIRMLLLKDVSDIWMKRPSMYVVVWALSVSSLFFQVRYETEFTSKVIVPPAPYVAGTVKELLVDMGYKMYYRIDKLDPRFMYLEEFAYGFNKFGIKYASNLPRWIQPNGMPGTNDFDNLGNRSLNIAVDFSGSRRLWWPLYVQTRTVLEDGSMRFCHSVPQTFFRRIHSVAVRGYGHHRITLFMRGMWELGLPQYWNGEEPRHKMLDDMRNIPRHLAFPDNVHVPAEMKGRVIDVFVVGGLGLAAALSIASVEIVLGDVGKFKKKLKFLSN